MAASISAADWIRLPMAVAAASARAQELATTHTASALPRLTECPTVPEEVQTAAGVFAEFSFRPTRILRGDAPAKIPTVTGRLTGEHDDADTPALDKLRALDGVREFPSRIKCATLAWHALNSAPGR